MKRFWSDDSGVTMTEALISFPIVLLVFAAFAEFGYAVSQWNQTVKALHVGARLVVVSDPVTSNFTSAILASPGIGGTPFANDGVTSVCGPNQSNCISARLNAIVFGSDGVCGVPANTSTRVGMCDVNPLIGPSNVVITYERTGLGYWGRPYGPVVTVRVEVRNMNFDLPVIGALLGISNSVPIPALPVTVTSEDMRTCSTCT